MTSPLRADDFRASAAGQTSEVILAAWAGFQSRRGAYGGLDAVQASRGEVALTFGPEGRDAAPLRAAELALCQWAVTHQVAVRDAALAALLDRYPALREEWLDLLDEPQLVPEIGDAAGFRAVLGLHTVYVHVLAKEGLPYVGLEFGCSWDDEHGLGILLHGTRVVAIGGADTAFTLWMAERDARGA